MIINIPAPEEAKTYKQYVQLFKDRNIGVNASELNIMPPLSKMSRKQFYDWCWQQPDADKIHQAFEDQKA